MPAQGVAKSVPIVPVRMHTFKQSRRNALIYRMNSTT